MAVVWFLYDECLPSVATLVVDISGLIGAVGVKIAKFRAVGWRPTSLQELDLSTQNTLPGDFSDVVYIWSG